MLNPRGLPTALGRGSARQALWRPECLSECRAMLLPAQLSWGAGRRGFRTGPRQPSSLTAWHLRAPCPQARMRFCSQVSRQSGRRGRASRNNSSFRGLLLSTAPPLAALEPICPGQRLGGWGGTCPEGTHGGPSSGLVRCPDSAGSPLPTPWSGWSTPVAALRPQTHHTFPQPASQLPRGDGLCCFSGPPSCVPMGLGSSQPLPTENVQLHPTSQKGQRSVLLCPEHTG